MVFVLRQGPVLHSSFFDSNLTHIRSNGFNSLRIIIGLGNDFTKQVARPGGALPLWESVGMRRGFAPPFSAPGRSFCPPKFDLVYHFIEIMLGPILKSPIFSM